jgi:hypothetical protein
MSQLPGVEAALVFVEFMRGQLHHCTPEGCAEALAEKEQQPVVLASMDGNVLAYRVPTRGAA